MGTKTKFQEFVEPLLIVDAPFTRRAFQTNLVLLRVLSVPSEIPMQAEWRY